MLSDLVDCSMKKIVKITLALFLLLVAHTGVNTIYAQCTKVNTSFKAGEEVNYHAYYNWGFIWLDAGWVSFTVSDAKWKGQKSLKLESIGTTKGGYDRLFTVRDTFKVFVDPVTLTPFEFYQATNEGSTRAIHHYLFDEEESIISARISRDSKPFENTAFHWPDCSYDVLSMIYQARNINFEKYKKGTKIPISLLVDGEIHSLYIHYIGEEVVSDRSGRKFNCLKFKPLLVKGTIFKAGNDMTVWVTNDKNKVPIIVEAKILIGSVKAIIADYEGLKYPLTSEIK